MGKFEEILNNNNNNNGKIICSDLELFDVIPEGCIATAISFTGPRDTCRLATVSKLFKSAAYSDAVWSMFLPSDYRDILAKSEGCCNANGLVLSDSCSKRDLFFYLAHHPILIDNSTKSFFLDKSTGKKCFTISAKELAITWGDTPRYWAFRPSLDSRCFSHPSYYSESSHSPVTRGGVRQIHSSCTKFYRFPEVAELNSVCWLEIRGKIKASMLSPNTTYVAYLVFKMTENAYGFYSPVEVSVKSQGSKSKSETRKVYLQDEERRNPRNQIIPRRMSLFNRIRSPFFEAPPYPKKEDNRILPKERKDGWLEVEIGELFTRVGEDEVEMSVLEIEVGNWKSGLIVEGIDIRPKVVLE